MVGEINPTHVMTRKVRREVFCGKVKDTHRKERLEVFPIHGLCRDLRQQSEKFLETMELERERHVWTQPTPAWGLPSAELTAEQRWVWGRAGALTHLGHWALQNHQWPLLFRNLLGVSILPK